MVGSAKKGAEGILGPILGEFQIVIDYRTKDDLIKESD
jgi:hypothetical protein